MATGAVIKGFIDRDGVKHILEDAVALTGKADKVASATANNFAALDSNGNLIDSQKSASDFATPSDVAGKIAKVSSATARHLPILAADGSLTDSGKALSDMATNEAFVIPVHHYSDGLYFIEEVDNTEEIGSFVDRIDSLVEGRYYMCILNHTNNGTAEYGWICATVNSTTNITSFTIDTPLHRYVGSYNASEQTSGKFTVTDRTIQSTLDGKMNVTPVTVKLECAIDETSWYQDSASGAIFKQACSWGGARIVAVNFVKESTFDITLVGTLSASFNSLTGHASVVICVGGYKFTLSEHDTASSLDDLVWDNTGLTKTSISL